MPVAAYEAAWATATFAAEKREEAFRASFGLANVYIADLEFVVTFEGAWFGAWAASIGAGDSNPVGDCPCISF